MAGSHSSIVDLALRRRSPSSFDCWNIPALAEWLEAHGLDPRPGRISSEYGRYCRGGQLVVLYHSGSVVVQGTETERSVALLEQLVERGRA